MTFNELNLSAPLLRAIAEAGYETPSPIQAKAIPPVLEGRDLMGCAQTGTGKTAAFRAAHAGPPPRRQAPQAGCHPGTDAHPHPGAGAPDRRELCRLRQVPEAARTPSSLAAWARLPGGGHQKGRGHPHRLPRPAERPGAGRGWWTSPDIEIFVLDEADRMLDMGFVHDVKKVIAKLPKQRQNLMFSATMPKEIEQLAAGILHDPAFVKVDPVSSTVDRIDQSLYFVEKGNKKFLLPWLIKNLNPPVVNALVFSRTKHGADKIAKDLNKQGIPAAAIHGNKSQSARVAALEGFKAGRTKVLVATDIAARGIDISELSHVFNYDLPEVPETYVHRIGRTARAGADGTAVSFCAPEEKEYLAGIEKLNRRQIPVISGHPWDGVPAPVKAAPPVRGRKPKMEAAAEAPAPVEKPVKAAKAEKAPKAEKTAKAAKAVKAEPKAQKANATPKIEAKEEHLMDENQKRTPGGRNENRRSNNNRRREGGAAQAPSRGSNAQPKFDPHFVSAPETTPLRPAKKNLNQNQNAAPAAKPAAPVQSNNSPKSENNSRRDRNARGSRNERNDRGARPAQNQSGSQNEPRNAQPGSQPQANRRGSAFSAGQGAGRPARAPKAEPSRRGRVAAAKDEDPGLVLISRRPPQQKFTNFEEYMSAHGGATAPIEDHSEEV